MAGEPASSAAASPAPAVTDRYCKKCRYPLMGLTQPRCPECGLAFDLTDPRTYSTTPQAQRRRSTIVIVYAASFAAGSALAIGLHDDSASVPGRLWLAVATGCGPLWLLFGELWRFGHQLETWFSVRYEWLTPCVAAVLWAVWVSVSCFTPLRRLHPILHLLCGLAWYVCGALTIYWYV